MAPEKRSPAGLSGRRLALVIAGTALAAGTVAAVAMLAINRPHAWGAGAWISDFAKSPGMAGLFAMVAALVALGGIAHQVSQARNALEHQREVEQDRAWWTRFEWAAARAVPPDRSETPLPWPAVLSTFDALASSARDDVQKRAVGAIVEVAASRPHAATVARTEAGEPGQPSTDGETARLAMLAYLRTTENTPAASPAVRGLLYESEVRQALQRVASEWLVDPLGNNAPDAVVERNGRRVILEIKAYSVKPSRDSVARVMRQLARYIDAFQGAGGILVSPTEFPFPVGAESRAIVAVRWATPADDGALREALLELTS